MEGWPWRRVLNFVFCVRLLALPKARRHVLCSPGFPASSKPISTRDRLLYENPNPNPLTQHRSRKRKRRGRRDSGFEREERRARREERRARREERRATRGERREASDERAKM